MLNHVDRDLAAVAFDQLSQESETILLEVAGSPESRLASAVQQASGRENVAVRCSHWNGCDLGTDLGPTGHVTSESVETQTCLYFPRMWSLFSCSKYESTK